MFALSRDRSDSSIERRCSSMCLSITSQAVIVPHGIQSDDRVLLVCHLMAGREVFPLYWRVKVLLEGFDGWVRGPDRFAEELLLIARLQSDGDGRVHLTAEPPLLVKRLQVMCK